MIWQSEALALPHSAVAANLGVDRSTVSRTVSLFCATGGVSKKLYPKDRHFRKLSTPAQMLILHLVMSRPGIYLKEIREEIIVQLMIQVDISTIYRFLHENGLTRQKLAIVATQRDQFCRLRYISDISVYSPEMLIYLDETGADHRSAVRRFGFSLRGIPLQKETWLMRGKRMSAIAMISQNGLLDVSIHDGTTDGACFYEFAEKCLLPQLHPFNGSNPHSVVVMDNCVIHHVPEVIDIIEDVGAIVHFLPPYSPDLNPIEMTFSKVKSIMKQLDNSLHTDNIEPLMLSAFASVTPQDCQNWIKHCLNCTA